MKFIATIISVFMFCGVASAAHLHKEKDYQDAWCNRVKGVQEFRLEDKARVDCLTSEYAIEFDFAPKWAESIGQALYYGLKTGKTPGVVLIMENEDSEGQFFDRLKAVADKYGIMIWRMTANELEGK